MDKKNTKTKTLQVELKLIFLIYLIFKYQLQICDYFLIMLVKLKNVTVRISNNY